MTKWDDRFLSLAKTVSTWSKDPSTGVGAVIVDAQHRVVSLGFNGFPRGIKDDERLSNRTQKYEITIHAELNAILFAKHPLDGCTMYVYPLPPCGRCAAMVAQSGISRIVSLDVKEERWKESCGLGQNILKEAGVASFLVEK